MASSNLVRTVILLAACLAAASASLGAAVNPATSEAAPTGVAAHPTVFGENPDVVRNAYEYPITIGNLADVVAQTGQLQVRVGPSEEVALELAEFEIFLPGEKKVVFTDEAGNFIREEPIVARFFQGHVEGTSQTATVTIDPTGLYGSIRLSDRTISLQPVLGPDGTFLQQATWYTASLGSLPFAKLIAESESTLKENATAVLPMGGGSTTYEIWVKPVAETAYRTYASNYATRISSAYANVQSMFQTETDITILIYSVEAPAANYAGQNTCGGSNDSGLDNFRVNWVTPNDWDGPNSYGLFHAVDGTSSVAGCGYANCTTAPSGCLADSNVPTRNPYGSHAVQGKDQSCCDSYDPDETEHLGLTVGHELTHNSGEPDHPGDSENCAFGQYSNIMASESFWCINEWRVAQSQTRVENYAWSRIHP